jgi:hypothetical protein
MTSSLMGLWRLTLPLPPKLWKGLINSNAAKMDAGLDFMSTDHHLVRDFAVRELPRYGRPIPPHKFTEELALPIERVLFLLQDLEEHMTFLFRNERGEVAWAYPMTVDRTPHRLTFSTGETINAA